MDKIPALPSDTKISLTGDLGSGKSAVSSILCEWTGFSYLSTGKIQRQLAEEMGVDTLTMNRMADTDPSIDEKIDAVFASLNKDPKGYVIDSRMAWFFVPNSIKVYLITDLAVAAERILKDPQRNSEQYTSVEEAVSKLGARKQSENARFLAKYGADCTRLDQFDLVIDTTRRLPAETAALILRGGFFLRQGIPFPRYFEAY